MTSFLLGILLLKNIFTVGNPPPPMFVWILAHICYQLKLFCYVWWLPQNCKCIFCNCTKYASKFWLNLTMLFWNSHPANCLKVENRQIIKYWHLIQYMRAVRGHWFFKTISEAQMKPQINFAVRKRHLIFWSVDSSYKVELVKNDMFLQIYKRRKKAVNSKPPGVMLF